MKITFNWGTGIFIFLMIFLITIFSFIYFSYQQQTDLVEEDYYPKEIEYQKQIEKMNNLKLLGEEIIADKTSEVVVLSFPDAHKDNIKGKIFIYRPSDAALDTEMEIVADENNQQLIATNNFKDGKFIFKINWTSEGKEYYQEIVYVKWN